MTTLTDNFNRADSVTTINPPSDGLANYVTGGGALVIWGISSSQGRLVTDGGNGTNAAVRDAAATVVSVQVSVPVVNSILRSGVITRWKDQNNFWAMSNQPFSQRLVEYIGGTPNTIGESGANYQNNDVIKIDASAADVIRTFLNGTTQQTTTSSDYNTATQHGLFCIDNTVRFDDLTITDNGTPPVTVAKVFLPNQMTGLGAGGPFFANPIGRLAYG